MSDDSRDSMDRAHVTQSVMNCERDAQGHCITCSDEALPALVLHIDQEAGLAQVMIKDMTEEIDVTLVEPVAPGDQLLVHGGVAIGRL